MKDTLATLLGGASGAGPAPVAQTPEVQYIYQPVYTPVPSEQTWIPVYAPPVYQTQIPVIPSEPGVSEGVPTGSNIPLCPIMTTQNRFPGDMDLICQCPKGNIQGGNSVSMNTLMWGTDAASVAWRNAFCM